MRYISGIQIGERSIVNDGELLTIASDRLTVALAKPYGSVYGGTRFDHAGFVTSILLDSETQFAAPEAEAGSGAPTSGGLGLNSMYFLAGDEATAEVGERYIRMGAGYIKRTEEPWSFMRLDYDYEPFDVTWRQKPGEVSFTTQTRTVGGFGYKQIKRVMVVGNQLAIETTLVNTGESDMSVQEYNHNFLSLGGQPTDENTRLELPSMTDFGSPAPAKAPVALQDDCLRFTAAPEGWFMCTSETPSQQNYKPYSWRLSREGMSVSVSERDSFRPDRAVIWGKRHVISPEMYHIFTISSGDTHTWTRTWTFER